MIDAGPVEGTATEILATLNHRLGLAKPPDEWPGNGKALGSMLRRLAPNLRAVGVRVQLPEKGTGRTKRCVFRFGKVGPEPSARPASSAPPANGAATTRNGPPTVPPECDPLRGGAKPCDAADRADHADHCGPTTAEASGVANKDASDLGEGEGEWTA
jgi:hypothetical protein